MKKNTHTARFHSSSHFSTLSWAIKSECDYDLDSDVGLIWRMNDYIIPAMYTDHYTSYQGI